MILQNKTGRIAAALVTCILTAAALTGCRHSYVYEEEEPAADESFITVGFSQVGAESGYRTANTDSMKDTFSLEHGYNLLFDDGQQKQEKQITAIRNFIQQEVDYIVLAPVTETGWDTVLQEAREANIPVIIVDRMVNVADDTLYTAWVGSDFRSEGDKVCEWLAAWLTANEIAAEDVHIADIQGTEGASAQIGRTAALQAASRTYGWDICATEVGDFVSNKGKEAVQRVLRTEPEVNILYCENDNEAFGALEALDEAGKKVGTDITNGEIMVISFDATGEGLQYVVDGSIAVNMECNPLHGPRVEELILRLEYGQTVEKRTYVDEQIFAGDSAVRSISVGEERYSVTTVTQELVDERPY